MEHCYGSWAWSQAECYKFERWAEDFISLADNEFKVTEEGMYDEKGSCFRPSFRIGMMVSRLHSLNSLRGDSIDGSYSISGSLTLCQDIVEMASKIELVEKYRGELTNYHRIQHEVAWRRKHLAVAHSVIASHWNILTEGLTQEDFHKVVTRHGLEVNQDFVDPFALIAEQYRLAAKNELPDAESAAVFWWGVDANMARAESRSGFTLGEVRSAISEVRKQRNRGTLDSLERTCDGVRLLRHCRN
jgi:hypothetical protein